MRKLEKEMLQQINTNDSTYCATDWASGSDNWTGTFTNDKIMRRIYAVTDLAEAGLVVDHYGSLYHNHNVTCVEC